MSKEDERAMSNFKAAINLRRSRIGFLQWRLSMEIILCRYIQRWASHWERLKEIHYSYITNSCRLTNRVQSHMFWGLWNLCHVYSRHHGYNLRLFCIYLCSHIKTNFGELDDLNNNIWTHQKVVFLQTKRSTQRKYFNFISSFPLWSRKII